MYTKVFLAGHVHDRPHHKISTYHSIPRGISFDELQDLVKKFDKSCTRTTLQIN